MVPAPVTDSSELTAVLRETGWLKRLARSLTRDEASADDVVQETLHRVVARRPRFGSRGPRPWLATVARNLARNASRDPSARLTAAGVHDSEPVDEVSPAAADAAAKAELQRHMAAELLALEEPYRSVLLLRFVDGLGLRATARRLGLPVETVRTRQRRGLERLRARLDDAHGSRGRWVLALTSLFPTSPPILATALTMTAHSSPRIVAGLVVLLALGAGVLFALGSNDSPAAAGGRKSSDPQTQGTPRRADEAAREVVATIGRSEAEPPKTGLWQVTGRVLAEESWTPLAEASVQLVLRPGTPDRPQRVLGTGTTDRQGNFALAAADRIESASLDLVVRAPDRARAIEQVTLDRSLRQPRDADLGTILLPPGTRVSGRVLDADRRPIDGAQLWFVPDCVRLGPLRDWAILREAWPVGRTQSDGSFLLDESLTARRITPPLLVAVHPAGVGHVRLVGLRRAAHRVADIELSLARSHAAEVTVLAHDGSPAADVDVLAVPFEGPLGSEPPAAEIGLAPFADRFRVTTDAAGRALFPALPASEGGYAFHALTDDGRRAVARSSQTSGTPPVTTRLQLPTAATLELGCLVLDEARRPLAGATLHASGRTARSDDTGRVSIHLTSTPGRPTAWTVRAPGHLPARGSVRTDEPHPQLEVVLDAARTIRGRVVTATDAPIARARVSVAEEATFTDDAGRFALTLAPRSDTRLVVDPPGPAAALSVAVAADDDSEQRVVVSDPDGRRVPLTVQIRDAHGAPLEARSVTLLARTPEGPRPGPELVGRIGRSQVPHGVVPGAWQLRVLTWTGAELLDSFEVGVDDRAVVRELVAPPVEPITVALGTDAAGQGRTVRIRFDERSQRCGLTGADQRAPLHQDGALTLDAAASFRVLARDPDRLLAFTIEHGEGRARLELPPGPAPQRVTLEFAQEATLVLAAETPWPEDRAALFLWRDGAPKGPERPYPLFGLEGETELFRLTIDPGLWHYELRAHGEANGPVRARGRVEVAPGRTERAVVDR